jgi:phenylalanyl-tRNA synthetase beta chain
MDGHELMEFYESDRKLSKFLHIIRDAPRYPVIYDSEDRVLSLPPIINGDHSKISLKTKNVFIECTATDLTKANVVLNTIVTIFSQYATPQFSCEPIQVVYPDGKQVVYPKLDERTISVDAEYINSCIGINEPAPELVKLINRMSLKASLLPDQQQISVTIPPTRSDILHACDVMEDAAIAFNFNRIKETLPKSSTIAVPLPINKLSDAIRMEIAHCGYTEVLAFTLVFLLTSARTRRISTF